MSLNRRESGVVLNDATDLVAQLTGAADDLDVTVRIISEAEWTHGEAKGICERLSLVDAKPLVEVCDRENDADLARHAFHQIGAYDGPTVFLYNEYATDIRHREQLDRLLEGSEDLWIVPADVHF